LYVVGCEYVPLGVGASLTIRDGFGRDATLQAVQDALRVFLWALQPGGLDGGGWTLGRAVTDRELEVAVARVAGVQQVNHITLFTRDPNDPNPSDWTRIVPSTGSAATVSLFAWQLPELLAVLALDSDAPITSLAGLPNPFAPDAVAVPVVPELC
jgi:hypothetical protein